MLRLRVGVAWCLAWAMAATLLSGCNRDRGPERVIVSGKVTYKGKPVENGAIRFVPAGKSSMPTAGAYIVNGQYVAESQGGIPVGAHKVQIEAYSVIRSQNPSMRGSPASRLLGDKRGDQYLPDKYNVNSELEITLPPGSGKFTKDFDLTD
jgi:hypothetical protein